MNRQRRPCELRKGHGGVVVQVVVFLTLHFNWG